MYRTNKARKISTNSSEDTFRMDYFWKSSIEQSTRRINLLFLCRDTVTESSKKFWKIEEVDRKVSSNNDEQCENHFITHSRDNKGRFTVSLPFQGHPSELGESRTGALNRLHRVEKRFQRDSRLKEEYIKFMQEYAALNHMSPVDVGQEQGSPVHYILHHAVCTKVNDRLKFCVVFDASAKTFGKSLNDILRVGLTIQDTLFSIVIQFRHISTWLLQISSSCIVR